jgi:hypothetical protein
MQVAGHLPAHGGRVLDETSLRGARLRSPDLRRVPVTHRLLGRATLGDVGERQHRSVAVRHRDGRGPPGDGEHRTVAADEPLVLAGAVSPV